MKHTKRKQRSEKKVMPLGFSFLYESIHITTNLRAAMFEYGDLDDKCVEGSARKWYSKDKAMDLRYLTSRLD